LPQDILILFKGWLKEMLRKEQKMTLRCGNQVIDLTNPCVMGIINATPDSFYEPSRTGIFVEKAVESAVRMLSEGASIIDVGGMSTRPGADEISISEELERVMPVVGAIHDAVPDAIISIDTYRAEVAQAACMAGASIINDVSGGIADPGILKVASDHQAAFVLMHRRGTSKTMQYDTEYEDIVGDLIKYFVTQIQALHHAGVRDIVLDPGFGFAKTQKQNFLMIDRLGVFQFLGYPLLVGVSRKSSLSKTVGKPAEETLFATTALHMAALQNGASILRVHDVVPAMDTISVYNQLILTKE
jgi:dihydropteroate synthase